MYETPNDDEYTTLIKWKTHFLLQFTTTNLEQLSLLIECPKWIFVRERRMPNDLFCWKWAAGGQRIRFESKGMNQNGKWTCVTYLCHWSVEIELNGGPVPNNTSLQIVQELDWRMILLLPVSQLWRWFYEMAIDSLPKNMKRNIWFEKSLKHIRAVP